MHQQLEPRSAVARRIFIVETSLGWQVISQNQPTHIAHSEDDAHRFARSLGGKRTTIVVVHRGDAVRMAA